jgi:hypothetical protein
MKPDETVEDQMRGVHPGACRGFTLRQSSGCTSYMSRGGTPRARREVHSEPVEGVCRGIMSWGDTSRACRGVVHPELVEGVFINSAQW